MEKKLFLTRRCMGFWSGMMFALSLSLPLGAAAGQEGGSNRFLIQLGGDVPPDLALMIAEAGGSLDAIYPQIGIAIARSDHPDFAVMLEGSEQVPRVTRDESLQWVPDAASLSAEVATLVGGMNQIPPSDPEDAVAFGLQWNMQVIQAPVAWAAGQFGDPGVKVAVLDTGIDFTHQELEGRVDLVNSASFVSNSACGPVAASSILDFNLHGTFVSSQITTNNVIIAGVAPSTEIVAVKVLDCLGSGSFLDVIAGILYTADLEDVAVQNLSLGARFPKQAAGPLVAALNKAVNYANSRGQLVVAAACEAVGPCGNEALNLNRDKNYTSIPAQSGAAIAIYATTSTDELAEYSDFGNSGTWIGAPGGDGDNLATLVLGACSQFSVYGLCAGSNEKYLAAAGTSFAAPLVAGVAALIDGKDENLGSLNGGDLKTKLAKSADDLGKRGVDLVFSHGRLNAGIAVQD